MKQKIKGSRNLQPAHQHTQPAGGEQGTFISTNKLAVQPRHHNPSPLVKLIGHTNEATVVVEGEDDGTGRYWLLILCPY